MRLSVLVAIAFVAIATALSNTARTAEKKNRDHWHQWVRSKIQDLETNLVNNVTAVKAELEVTSARLVETELQLSIALAMQRQLGFQLAAETSRASSAEAALQRQCSVEGERAAASIIGAETARALAAESLIFDAVFPPCPAQLNAAGSAPGCVCKEGFSGTLTFTVSNGYSGSCQPVACPPGTTGASVPAGCHCPPGTSGHVNATRDAPFYVSTCTPVSCPAHSSGPDVADGCTCNAGYTGEVAATSVAPFFTSTCVGLSSRGSSCLDIFNTCDDDACPSGDYWITGSDGVLRIVYCLMDPAAPFGAGWTVLAKGGEECQDRVSELSSTSSTSCGYLSKSIVRTLAGTASSVMLLSTDSLATSMASMSGWSRVYSSPNDNAIVSLRNGVSWQDADVDWLGDNWCWSASRGQSEVYEIGWPYMYHTSNYISCVHWILHAGYLHGKDGLPGHKFSLTLIR